MLFSGGQISPFSFCHFGFFSCLSQRLNEPVRVLINDKRSDRVIKGLLESGRRSNAMYASRNQRIFYERLHRPVLIGPELALVDISPRRDRAFEQTKGLLP